MREIVWRWPSTATARSSCVQPGERTNYPSLSLASHPRIVTTKQTGDGREAGNPGEERICAGCRRFRLVDVRPTSRARAGRKASSTGAESENLQREVRPGAGMPYHESGERLPIRSGHCCRPRRNWRSPGGPSEECRLEGAPRRKAWTLHY